MPDLPALGRMAEAEFFEIVQSVAIIENKPRVALIYGSYIDFWWSEEMPGRFAYHWERTRIDGTIHRHDNIPHLQWRIVGTSPKHFHSGAQQTVTESDISEHPEKGIRQFLQFASNMIGRLMGEIYGPATSLLVRRHLRSVIK